MKNQLIKSMKAQFEIGDAVNVRYGRRWLGSKFYISYTWYTPENGRQYNIRENGDTFKETEVRLAK